MDKTQSLYFLATGIIDIFVSRCGVSLSTIEVKNLPIYKQVVNTNHSEVRTLENMHFSLGKKEQQVLVVTISLMFSFSKKTFSSP